MDRSILMGIIGGLVFFLVICSFILLNGPDFDEQLIVQVERGVPAEELVPQIDAEAYRMELNAKKRLDTAVMDRKYWGNGDLDPPDNYRHYMDNYETEMRLIKKYTNLRLRFAKRELSEEEFLKLIDDERFYFSHV